MNPFVEFAQGMMSAWANVMLSQYVVTARFLYAFSDLPLRGDVQTARPLRREYTPAPDLGPNVLRLTRAFHLRGQR